MAGRKAFAALGFAAAFLGASAAWAGDKTWTGATSTTWSTASNWTPAGAPGNNDRAIIPNTVRDPVVRASTTIGQLWMQGGIVTINNGVTLSVRGRTGNGGGTAVSPVIRGNGTVTRVGTGGSGILAVTGGLNNGVAINDTITLGNFTYNAAGVSLSVAPAQTVTFNGNVVVQSGTLHVGDAGANPAFLDINGTLNVAAAGTLDMRGDASTMNLSGTLTLAGTWTPGTSSVTLDPTANQALNITTGAPRQFYDLTILTNAGNNQVDGDLVTPSAAMTINNNLAIMRGQFQIGQFTVIVNGNIVSGTPAQSQLDFTNTGTLRARGNVDIASLSQITTQVNGPFATIVMDGTAPQTFQIRATSGSQYHDIDHFQVSNPAGVTVLDNPGGDFTVNGQLTIDPDCSLTVQDVFDPESPLVMGAAGTLRLENIIRPDSTILGSTFTAAAGSTVVYAGQAIGQIVYAQQNNGAQIQYQNLTIDNVGAVATQQNVANALSVNGNFTILSAAASFSGANTRNLVVRQSFIDHGTFTHGGNTVTMAGTGAISGTAASLVFNNLLVDGAVTDLVTAQRSFTTAATFQVNQGALATSGNLTMTASAGLSVGNGAGAAGSADLNLVGPATLAVAPGETFLVNGADGRFTSVVGGGANPTLTSGGAGAFTAAVAGQADLFGLNFGFGDANGLDFSATATIERLRNVRFTNINAAAGAHHLTIRSTGLDLDAPGCMFDAVGAGQWNVWAVDTNAGNGVPVRLRFEERTASNGPGAIGGPGAGEAFDGDDDTNDNGVIAAPETVSAAHGGAIVQWVYTANIDMVGAVQGFPLAAFDWNTFTYYSTYVVMQNTAAFDSIYVLDTNGDLKSYSYTLATAGARIVGPIFWDSEGASHVVYFGTNNGQVYKLIDNGSSLVPAPAPWNTPFSDGPLAEVTSPVISDRTTVYFAGRRGNNSHGLWNIDIATKTMQQSPAIQLTSVRLNTAPSWAVGPQGTTLFWGASVSGTANPSGSRLFRVVPSNWGNVDAEFNRLSAVPPAPPDPAANQDCTADILAITNVVDSAGNPTPFLYVGEMNGYMHGVNALGVFTEVRPGFPFRDTASAIRGGAVMDWFNNRLFFGNAAGSLYTLGNSTGTWTLNTNYWRFATGGGPIQTMPLYQAGLLYASNANGNLYVLDVNTGAGQALVRTWNLGITAGTNDVSDVSRDFNTSRIYVGTSGGRLYAVPQTVDPTPAAP